MTKLNGSEKQIAWATEIREYILNGSIKQGFCVEKGINQELVFVNKSLKSDSEEIETVTDEEDKKDLERDINSAKKRIELFTALKNRVESEKSSVWFIDNRSNSRLFNKEIFSK